MERIETSYIYKTAAVLVIVLLAAALLFACGSKEEPEEPEKKKTEYAANSPLGIAETYVGENVQDLIIAVGTLKGDPVIEPTNDGGGYEGTYEFDGFTAYTYAKSEDADAIVTEIVPDTDSDVYKESLKKENDGGDK